VTDAGGGAEGCKGDRGAATRGGRRGAAGAGNGRGAAAGEGMWSVPYRFAHCGRRTGGAEAAGDSGAPDCWRDCGRSNDGVAAGNEGGSFMAGRSGWELPALQARDGESLRFARLHGLLGGWRICGICGGTGRVCVSVAGEARG